MAATGGVTVYGLDEFAKGTRKLVDNIDDGADNAFGSVADQVAATVRGSVPHQSGRLAGSVTTGGGLFREGATVGMGGFGVAYAGWIDYGGTRGRAYVRSGRYLYPAAHAAESTCKRAGEDCARDEIRRMHWPRPNKW